MLSRFFHVRFALKPFAAPSTVPAVPDQNENRQAGGLVHVHVDYDRQPLETSGFDHYVEWNEDNERFFVH